MARGKAQWNCWSLPYSFGSRDYVGSTRIWKVKLKTSRRLKVKTETE